MCARLLFKQPILVRNEKQDQQKQISKILKEKNSV